MCVCVVLKDDIMHASVCVCVYVCLCTCRVSWSSIRHSSRDARYIRDVEFYFITRCYKIYREMTAGPCKKVLYEALAEFEITFEFII